MGISPGKGCSEATHPSLNAPGKAFGVGMGDARGSSRAVGMNMNPGAVSPRLRAGTGTRGNHRGAQGAGVRQPSLQGSPGAGASLGGLHPEGLTCFTPVWGLLAHCLRSDDG